MVYYVYYDVQNYAVNTAAQSVLVLISLDKVVKLVVVKHMK